MDIQYHSDVVKLCTKCGQSKPPQSFSTGRAQCKPCRSVISANWYRANPDKINRELRLARSLAWQSANREVIAARARARYAKDPSRNRAATIKWQQQNQDKHAAAEARRRAIQLQATPNWADDAAIKRVYAQARREGKEVDHIVPLKSKLVCGLHCEANLQLLPKSENVRKNNRHWPDMP